MENPLISIVMCTYNGEKYLRKQLDSIINQTYKPIELIIVDDCSSDETSVILEEYKASHDYIEFYINEKNLGFNKNFERGLSLTTGSYIAISDQDDIWYPEKLEQLYPHIGPNLLIFSNSELIDEKDNLLGRQLLGELALSLLSYRSVLIYNFVTGHTILMKRDLLQLALPFPHDGYYDWWLGFIALKAHKLTYLNKVLTKYRIHEESIIRQKIVTSANGNNSMAILNYRSTLIQLNYFLDYLKINNETVFIDRLVLIYTKKRNALKKILDLAFIYLNYNALFPMQKKRKLISSSRFKLVKTYLKEVYIAKCQ
jgi:glycosyltransferase involved in cell wall biosynthesis